MGKELAEGSVKEGEPSTTSFGDQQNNRSQQSENGLTNYFEGAKQVNSAAQNDTGLYGRGYTEEEASKISKVSKKFINLIAGKDIGVINFFKKWQNGRKSNQGEKLEKLYLGKTTEYANQKISKILGYSINECN